LDSKTGESNVNIVTPCSGIVSYYIDGFEEVYSLNNLKKLDVKKISGIKSVSRHIQPGIQVEQGQTIFKIVNNLDPVNIVTEVIGPLGTLAKSNKKNYYLILSTDEKDLVPAVLTEKRFQGSANKMLFSVAKYNNSLLIPRIIDLKIVTDRFEGFIIPESTIVKKSSKEGIYTVYKERVKWKDIEIIGKSQGKVAISGITPDIKVILNPEYVKEGISFK
jgi:putative membrane fusion protein